jgi:hypothetical protein
MIDACLDTTTATQRGTTLAGEATMRKRLRENSLSLVMFSLFGLCLLGHSVAGYAAYCDDQQAHQQPSIRLHGLYHEQPFLGLRV